MVPMGSFEIETIHTEVPARQKLAKVSPLLIISYWNNIPCIHFDCD
jgi:hypothetical protein